MMRNKPKPCWRAFNNSGACSKTGRRPIYSFACPLGQAPFDFAQQRFVELFQRLESVATSWHSTPGYCALQIQLVESVILAVVSDDFSRGAELRRWLDDDEYLIRKRMHDDLRAMMAQSEG